MTEDDGIRVYRPCRGCRRVHREGGFRLTGLEGDHLVRRALAYRNYAGAGEVDVRRATTAIERAGSTERLARRVAALRVPLGRLEPVDSLALEIAVNEETERRLLEMELAELEARWEVEEEIASIADGERTPLTGLAALKRAAFGGRRTPHA